MKAINVLLAFLVSAIIGILVLEGGLRLIGKGPAKTLVAFDPQTGWSKRPDFEYSRSKAGTSSGRGYDVTIKTNAQGLNDDPMDSLAKPAGTFRVLALGDSFTQGFSVDREHLFVDRLESWWQAEGRKVEIINAGTEAFDTAQQVAWLMAHGADYDPDLILLFPYQNDLYWNTQTAYMTPKGPREKPRFSAQGELENGNIPEPEDNWFAGTAIGGLLGGSAGDDSAHVFEIGGRKDVHKEFAPLFTEEPDFQADISAHTRGALLAFQKTCASLGAEAVVVPIPDQSLYASSDGADAGSVTGLQLGGVSAKWSANRPVKMLLDMSAELGLVSFDVRPHLSELHADGTQLYFAPRVDWHFNPDGNAAFATFLHGALEGIGGLPAATTQVASAPEVTFLEEEEGFPFAAKLFLTLWAFLTILYWGHYKDEAKWLPPLRVGAMLGIVFATFLGVIHLQSLLPPAAGQVVGILIVLGVLGFVAYKMGNRLATIFELLRAFTLRGHWYLMPLVVVLLTIGSLLVVAASSPLVAPFIYTLF